MTIALFLALGVAVGLIGTLIGVGGGFIMVPVLFACYPGATPAQITAVSFFAILANSLSGTISYARMKPGRIDYRTGVVFALATLPGTTLGAWLTTRISVGFFEAFLAALMALGATLMLVLGGREKLKQREAKLAAEGNLAQSVPLKGLLVGSAISLLVGVAAAMGGIGGGVFHVPVMVFILSFAVHRATATSQFILAIAALNVTAVHLFKGSLDGYWPVALALAAGAVIGAQFGAKLSTKTPPAAIVRALAVLLLLVAGRLAWRAFAR
ncbi:MAG: sulfite exporter TauE/SafE family protein [Phycisphaerales bacterium]|nr:sulfite exporter TauE/SafE family protein [Phycisphaerales bacterium]